MIWSPAKLLAFIAYDVRTASCLIWDDGLEDFRAQAIIALLELFMLIDIWGLSSVGAGHLLARSLLTADKVTVFVACGALVFMNHRFLSNGEASAKYKLEFDSYSTTARVIAGVGVLALLLALMIGSFLLAEPVRRLPR